MTTKTKKNVEALEKSLNSSNVVETLDQLEALISRVHKAQRIFATFSQEKVDAIFKAAAGAADKARIPLARMAVEETGMGVLEDKIIKISLPNKYKKMSNKEILDLAIEKMYEQIANVEIERAMEKTRIMLGFAPEEYEIAKMKTLGTCKERKITINPEIVKYNRKVIDYVVLHQYCHLKYKTHSKRFFEMLEKYQPDYKKCEEILLNI